MQSAERLLSTYQDEFNDLRKSIAATPATATVKGMFVDSFLKSLDREGIARPTDKRYVAFKDYPLREFMELLLQATSIMYPTSPPRKGLRNLGRLAYPTLAESTVGKILFAIAGRDWTAALSLSRRAYEISLNPGNAELKEVTENSAVMSLRDVWNFADSYQAGVYEGAMECYLVEGTVEVKRGTRICDVDLILKWA